MIYTIWLLFLEIGAKAAKVHSRMFVNTSSYQSVIQKTILEIFTDLCRFDQEFYSYISRNYRSFQGPLH